jgi:hypothetical protein
VEPNPSSFRVARDPTEAREALAQADQRDGDKEAK